MTFKAPILAVVLLASALAGCSEPPPQALGTLEYDRIAVPAPVAERIVAIEVREGERVAAGQALLRLESTRVAATTQAANRGHGRLRRTPRTASARASGMPPLEITCM